jgi:membrane protein implicated in regulation of membrane protease activity
MSTLGFFVALANAPFAVALGVVAIFALLSSTGLLGILAGGGEGDHDVDGGDAGAEAEADADADADGEHAADAHDGDAHDGSGHERSLASTMLAPLGFGTIPISVIWQTFAFAFALAGYAMNYGYLGRQGGPPMLTLIWTLPGGFIAGCIASVGVNRLLAPVLSSKGQEATSRSQLVGQIGVVISSKVDREFGEVRIRDKSGHDVRVVCRLASGAARSPRESQTVVVVDCDDNGGLLVEPLDDFDAASEPGRTAAR